MKIGGRHRDRRDARAADQHGRGRQGRKAHCGCRSSTAKIVTGGKRHSLAAASSSPRCLSNVAPDAAGCRRKNVWAPARCFGFKDEADVIAMCNNSPFGLASYFYSRDLGGSAGRRSARIRHVRGQHGLITTEVAPFAASRKAVSREGSRHGMDEICRDQIRDDGGDLGALAPPRYPPKIHRRHLGRSLRHRRLTSDRRRPRRQRLRQARGADAPRGLSSQSR